METETLGYAESRESSYFSRLVGKHKRKIITGITLASLVIGFEFGRKVVSPPVRYPGSDETQIAYGELGDRFQNTSLYSLGDWIDRNFLNSEEKISTLTGLATAGVLGTLSLVGTAIVIGNKR